MKRAFTARKGAALPVLSQQSAHSIRLMDLISSKLHSVCVCVVPTPAVILCKPRLSAGGSLLLSVFQWSLRRLEVALPCSTAPRQKHIRLMLLGAMAGSHHGSTGESEMI
ncbi:hypothetical protein AMECASPLE_019500 [Ameca splendens]|uniref:Uncharacterized protein n=1 Tax=Ameca splendens TaxID=208324 RepID=A0ABV0XRY5_9TELE